MKSYPNETPEDIAARKRIGLFLTPRDLPESTYEDAAIALELLSRYPGNRHSYRYNGDCIALGRMLGRIEAQATDRSVCAAAEASARIASDQAKALTAIQAAFTKTK